MSRRCLSSVVPILLLVGAALPVAGAQLPASPPPVPYDSLYLRAAQLVRQGDGDAGRALVDSVLAATPEGDPAYGEGLYWRAALATSAAAAERDYKRVVVEFPASRRAEDALLTLSQLELARGDRARAVAHLERLQVEHPSSAHRARAFVWMARAQFDLRQVAEGCASLRSAQGAMGQNDVELRTQVEFLSGRCAPVTAAVATPAATPVSPPPAPERVSTPAREVRGAAPAAWAVQVAAYDTKREAEALVKRLVARGFQARVAGSAKPWRVKVGRYPSRADANAALARMKKAGLDGFVTGGD